MTVRHVEDIPFERIRPAKATAQEKKVTDMQVGGMGNHQPMCSAHTHVCSYTIGGALNFRPSLPVQQHCVALDGPALLAVCRPCSDTLKVCHECNLYIDTDVLSVMCSPICTAGGAADCRQADHRGKLERHAVQEAHGALSAARQG